MTTHLQREIQLTGSDGASAIVSPFGARLVELCVPDREGRLANVVLGFDDTGDYRRHADLYFGATVGRVAGRISRSRFSIDGRSYGLSPNEGTHHVHGGTERSLDRVEWTAEPADTQHGPGVVFSYVSPDGEEGYPGTLSVRVEYVLSDANELWTVLEGTADAPTPVNLTNHSYWNLSGAGAPSVLDHELTVAAERFVAMDRELIPTGALEAVAGTALDFRRPRRVGERLPEPMSEPWPGFDTAFALDEHEPYEESVRLFDPASGRAMDILTTEPSIQVYTANRVPELVGRHGRRYRAGNAICLEPQRMPDAVNRPEFPSIVLMPGDVYRHVTCYRHHVL